MKDSIFIIIVLLLIVGLSIIIINVPIESIDIPSPESNLYICNTISCQEYSYGYNTTFCSRCLKNSKGVGE